MRPGAARLRSASAGLAFGCIACLGACTVSVPRPDFSNYAMTVSGDGNIRAPTPRSGARANEEADYFSDIPPDKFPEYVDRLFAAVEKKGDTRVLIFVHGGLNSLAASTQRVSDLIGKYQKGGLPYYPIFVNWDSGLWESLADHLVSIRQGETAEINGAWTAPFYVLADIGRTVFRAPVTVGYTLHNDYGAFAGTDVTTASKEYRTNERENPRIIYQCLLQQRDSAGVSLGRETDWEFASPRLYLVSLRNVLTAPFQYLTAPPIDGFGTPAWEMMQRRAKVLFNKPEQFDIDRDAAKVAAAMQGRPPGAMTVFMDRLGVYLKKHPGTEVTVVAHSMGTFIVNEMIRAYPERHYENIVYMAGADSIRHTFDSILPYLRRPENRHTTFYNLTLHPQAEVEELSGYGFLPKGSLLVWIDNFFSTPETHYDRTVGRWDNLLPAWGEVPPDLRERIKIKAFDQDSAVAHHGDFGAQEFWRTQFWEPGKPGCDPWPVGKDTSCPAPAPSPEPLRCK